MTRPPLEAMAFEEGDPRRALTEAIVRRLHGGAVPLDWEDRSIGFAVRRAAVDGRPAGRPRLWFLPDDRGRIFAVAYKPSRLAFSRDRFAYGALSFRPGNEARCRDDLDALLLWLDADFKPALRPSALQRTIPLTLPPD